MLSSRATSAAASSASLIPPCFTIGPWHFRSHAQRQTSSAGVVEETITAVTALCRASVTSAARTTMRPLITTCTNESRTNGVTWPWQTSPRGLYSESTLSHLLSSSFLLDGKSSWPGKSVTLVGYGQRQGGHLDCTVAHLSRINSKAYSRTGTISKAYSRTSQRHTAEHLEGKQQKSRQTADRPRTAISSQQTFAFSKAPASYHYRRLIHSQSSKDTSSSSSSRSGGVLHQS